jgi:hypothetical protein
MKTYNVKTIQMAFALLLANEPNITRGQEQIFLKYGLVEIEDTIHAHDPYNLLG